MVAAPAAADAVARARRLPNLRVGLHLVVADGAPVLPPGEVPALVDADGRFSNNLLQAGWRYGMSRAARAQLAHEIRAQFAAFAATGLALDHANAHRHMHLHPVVGRLLVAIGKDFGLPAVRVPAEPADVLRQAGAGAAARAFAALHAPLAWWLRRQVRAAGLAANDHLLGLAWTGGMTEARLLRLVAALPAGVSELYSHPATGDCRSNELAALLSPAVRRAIDRADVALVGYGDLGAGPSSAGNTRNVHTSV